MRIASRCDTFYPRPVGAHNKEILWDLTNRTHSRLPWSLVYCSATPLSYEVDPIFLDLPLLELAKSLLCLSTPHNTAFLDSLMYITP